MATGGRGQFEEAAKEAADEVTRPRPEGEEVKDIQVLLQSDANPLQIRDLRVRLFSPFTSTPHLHTSPLLSTLLHPPPSPSQSTWPGW